MQGKQDAASGASWKNPRGQSRQAASLLPAATVTQFAKLHGVWADHAVKWPQLLLQSEPPGMPLRVDYAQLLQHLAR